MTTTTALNVWRKRWFELASFSGPHLTNVARKIQQVLDLWDEPIPGPWQRGDDPQLLGPRYRRGDSSNLHPGEHVIEHQILCQNFQNVRCLGGRLVDGINAIPLILDKEGVEADLYLLIEQQGVYHLSLDEVKATNKNPWYAAVQNLLQLKLLQHSPAALKLFHLRNPSLSLPSNLTLNGLVIAPEAYYLQRGKKANAVPHAAKLLREFTAKTGVTTALATWSPVSQTIVRMC